MSRLPDVSDALADALAPIIDEIEDLTIVQGQFLDLSAPAIEVYPGDPPDDEGAGFGQDSVMDWTIRARVGASDADGQQLLLLQLMEDAGPTSIKEALTSDQTLGGVVETLDVKRTSGILDAGSVLWMTWTARVYNTETVWT